MDNLQKVEQQLTRIENSIAASKQVLTFDETAQLTGLSKSYLYKLTSGGMIPHSKPMGKNLFFSRSEVEAWLMSRPVKTSAEISAQAVTYVTLKSVRP